MLLLLLLLPVQQQLIVVAAFGLDVGEENFATTTTQVSVLGIRLLGLTPLAGRDMMTTRRRRKEEEGGGVIKSALV